MRKLDVNCKASRAKCWVAPTVYLRDAVHAIGEELHRRGLAAATGADFHERFATVSAESFHRRMWVLLPCLPDAVHAVWRGAAPPRPHGRHRCSKVLSPRLRLSRIGAFLCRARERTDGGARQRVARVVRTDACDKAFQQLQSCSRRGEESAGDRGHNPDSLQQLRVAGSNNITVSQHGKTMHRTAGADLDVEEMCWSTPLPTCTPCRTCWFKCRIPLLIDPSSVSGADADVEKISREDAAANPDSLPHLCRRLRVSNVARVALVGSGKLTGAEQRAIRAADTIVRFDSVDRRCESCRMRRFHSFRIAFTGPVDVMGRLAGHGEHLPAVGARPQMLNANVSDLACCRMIGPRSTVWVSTFRQQAPGAPAGGGYAGLDYDTPPEIAAALRLADSLVFWGGLHHNIKTVREDRFLNCHV